MTAQQMRDKIIDNRNLIFDEEIVDRDFSFSDVKNLATVLVGARRTGKSSYLRLFARKMIDEGLEKEKVCYLSFFGLEDEEIRFSEIERAYYSLYPELDSARDVWFLLDEIQNVLFWGEGVSKLMDEHKCHVVVSGSSARYLSTDISTELRGRSIPYRFYPLSFREFCRFNGFDAEPSQSYDSFHRNKLSALYNDYLRRGSYPALATVDNPKTRKMVLSTYFDLAYSRDIIDRFEITKGTMLKHLMKRLVKNSGRPYSVNSLVHHLKSSGYNTSNELVSSYIDIIKDTCFFHEVRFFGTEKQQNVNPKKLYTIDPAMAVLYREFDDSIGIRLEHAVLMDLVRLGKDVFYYRDEAGKEADFIMVDEDTRPLAIIQVTDHLADNAMREIDGCRSAMKNLGLKESFIVTNDEFYPGRTEFDEGTIRIIPAWRFSLNTSVVL